LGSRAALRCAALRQFAALWAALRPSVPSEAALPPLPPDTLLGRRLDAAYLQVRAVK
jgi:hypothetical protein